MNWQAFFGVLTGMSAFICGTSALALLGSRDHKIGVLCLIATPILAAFCIGTLSA